MCIFGEIICIFGHDSFKVYLNVYFIEYVDPIHNVLKCIFLKRW